MIGAIKMTALVVAMLGVWLWSAGRELVRILLNRPAPPATTFTSKKYPREVT